MKDQNNIGDLNIPYYRVYWWGNGFSSVISQNVNIDKTLKRILTQWWNNGFEK